MEALKQDIETYPDAYQFERAKRLGVSSGGIFHALKRLKVTYQLLPAKAGSSWYFGLGRDLEDGELSFGLYGIWNSDCF